MRRVRGRMVRRICWWMVRRIRRRVSVMRCVVMCRRMRRELSQCRSSPCYDLVKRRYFEIRVGERRIDSKHRIFLNIRGRRVGNRVTAAHDQDGQSGYRTESRVTAAESASCVFYHVHNRLDVCETNCSSSSRPREPTRPATASYGWFGAVRWAAMRSIWRLFPYAACIIEDPSGPAPRRRARHR